MYIDITYGLPGMSNEPHYHFSVTARTLNNLYVLISQDDAHVIVISNNTFKETATILGVQCTHTHIYIYIYITYKIYIQYMTTIMSWLCLLYYLALLLTAQSCHSIHHTSYTTAVYIIFIQYKVYTFLQCTVHSCAMYNVHYTSCSLLQFNVYVNYTLCIEVLKLIFCTLLRFEVHV